MTEPVTDTDLSKHLNDARGVLTMRWKKLDLEAIRRGARANGVLEQFEELLEAVQEEDEWG